MKQSALDFYDYYHLRGDSVHIDGTRSLKIPSGTTLQRPKSSSAMLRHNSQENIIELGLDDSWLLLADRPNVGTFVLRTGDSMIGHLNMWEAAKIYNTDGNQLSPSYSFVNDTDTGIFRNNEDGMAVIVGGSIEHTPIVRFERFGQGQREKNTYFEGDVWIDEITFTRRGELKLDGEYAYFTGSNGLRLPQGTTSQRLPDNNPVPVALTRYNNLTNNFEFGYADTFTEFDGITSNWGILSHKKDTSTWLVRKGDSMYGDIQMVQNARILLERGTASQPSLTFDVDRNTGLYKTPNGFSIAVESDILDTPAVSFERKDNNSHDGFNTYFQGDVWIDEITFTRKDSLKLDGDYAYFTGNRGLTLPRGDNVNRFAEVGITRYNNEQNVFEMYHTDEWLQFSGRQDTDTYINRKGDSIYGDLRFTNNARNRNIFGNADSPSITFNGREDIGFYTTGDSNISFSLDASVNNYPLFSADRYGTGNKERNFYLNSKLFVDEIVSNEFLFTSNKVTISGATGLRTAVGNTEQRNNETGIIRFNTDNDGFDLRTSDEWLILSGNQDIDTYVNRKGDSIYGDLRFTNDARSRHSYGTANKPSITFNGREDIGFYTTGDSNISFSLDASVNSYPLFSADRYGTGNKERNFYLNSKLFVDEIVSNEFLFSSNKVTIAGATGLRTAIGNSAQRINETGIIRFNTDNDGFDLRTSDEWLILSGNQDQDTYINRKGDSIYGDLRFTSDARSRHSYGNINNPSITFLNDEDTGFYRDNENSIGIVLGSSLNNTPVLHMTRNNNTNTGNTVTINGDLIVTGTASQINTTDTNILDNIITLNKNGGNVLSGIEVEIDGTIRGRLQYSYSTTEWSVDNNFISDVKYAVDPDHAVNKQLLDDTVDVLRTEYTFLINQERDRTIAEETRIEGKLDDEINRSITRDDAIELALNSEITRATTRENEIELNLNSEVTRATTRENEIELNLNSEVTRATTRENEIETNLNSEVTRATTRENEIETNLNSEVTRATTRENEIELNLNSEVTRATTRENEIELNLNSEVTRATTRENEIELAQTAIIESFGINKYVFTTTVLSGETYDIVNSDTGDFDLLDSIVDVKIINPDDNSPTYNKYINYFPDVLVTYDVEEINIHNNSLYDLVIRVVVLVR